MVNFVYFDFLLFHMFSAIVCLSINSIEITNNQEFEAKISYFSLFFA